MTSLDRHRREPILNLPGVVIALVVVIVAVHVWRQTLSEDGELRVLLRFAFIPARYADIPGAEQVFPLNDPARIWTVFSYAFLHGDWTHLGFNALWLTAFGSPVAWRFGALRFLALFFAGAAAGALVHAVVHAGEIGPMVGASAAISAITAAALRFMFDAGAFVGDPRPGPAGFSMPAPPIAMALRDPRVVGFLIVWFVVNVGIGLFGGLIAPEGGLIAWEAHVGGFVAGLILFALLDPVERD